MNILFTIDQRYVMPLTVCLTSIFENNPKVDYGDINVYIMHSELLLDQVNVIQSLIKSYNQKLVLISVDEHYFSTAPVFSWTKETYYRLLTGEYLPEELDRILYLDCDIIVNKPLKELYNTDLKNYFIGAVEETGKQDLLAQLGLDTRGQYFNTGVMLMNLNKCKDLLNYEKVSLYIKEMDGKIFKADEGILNIMFKNKIKTLDLIYNNYIVTDFNAKRVNRLFNLDDKKMMDETCIFHFFTKPWNNLYPASCEKVWFEYLKLSPYKNLYFDKFNKFRYKLLKLGLVKLFLYKCLSYASRIDDLVKRNFSEKTHQKLLFFYRRNIK